MEIVTKIAPIALALIMLGLGLGLSTKNFLRILNHPKDFILGLTCQLILLPIVAYTIVSIFNTPIEIAIGVMIIAAAPGGVTSNVMTKFAKGDVALSVTLTAVISLISIISVPFVVFNAVNFLGTTNISKEVSLTGVALKMAGVVTVPVIIGMIIRNFFEKFISLNINFIDKITGLLFLIVFAAIWIEERENILSYLYQSGIIVLTLNIAMMLIAYFIAKSFASGIPQVKCIAIECGLQNGTLAVFVATQLFDEIIYIVPTASYALMMYITGFIFVYILRKSN
tara:strand:- start:1761 stop:2609 length:849 start_codon:yes stop_codon:yes gene_type:complete